MNRILWNLTIGFPAVVFIVALGLGVWILTREAPYAAPFGEVAPFEAIAAPDLGLGDTMLSGIVRDTAGQPIADATVVTTQGNRVRRDRTDEQGQFRLPELTKGQAELTVLVLHRLPTSITVEVGSGLQEITIENPVITPPEPAVVAASDLEIELFLPQSDGSPEGMILAFDPAGAPQAGDRAPRRMTLSGAREITVPDLPHGSWILRLLPPDGARDFDWDLLQPLGESTMRLSHPGPEPLPLIVHTGTIAGVLRDEEGKPISGALVLAIPANGQGPSLPTGETDGNGRVRWEHVPEGQWLIRWRARGAGAETPVTVERGVTADPFPKG